MIIIEGIRNSMSIAATIIILMKNSIADSHSYFKYEKEVNEFFREKLKVKELG